MANITKGQMEAQISVAIINFEKEYMGRGPKEIKTYIIKDMIFIRLKGVLTPAEEQLAKTDEGANLIKKVRVQLLESARVLINSIIKEITGYNVISLHTDISTKTGERIIVFTLNKDLEDSFEMSN
ncbi:MAG: Na-translocating system protein MpsC family protein [Candidatus Humimicrobiaceae bacterium]